MESLNINNLTENLKLDKIKSLKNREVERQQNIQKKRDEYNQRLADNEKLDFFHAMFSEKQLYINNLINNSKNICKEKLAEHFNDISKEIILLQKYVASSNIFLRHYDLQKCQDTINELTTHAKSLEDELLPKKKFSFKNKSKQEKNIQHSNGTLTKDEIDSSVKYKLDDNRCGYFNRKAEFLELKDAEIFQKDVNITNLENCTVCLRGSPSTLHLNHLKNCNIFSGPVSTSIFAENCENSILVIACQQLRLHSSKNIQIYLHVTSRAIMEDCTDINVAPYNWKYFGIEKDFEKANLSVCINNWKCFDDFNWLNEKHSPNWKEIKDEDQIKDWNLFLLECCN